MFAVLVCALSTILNDNNNNNNNNNNNKTQSSSTCINSALLCSWRVAKHTLHVPHFLFASSDNDQVCECGAAGNARLVDGDEGTGRLSPIIRLLDVTGLLRIIPSWSARTLVFVAILNSWYCYRLVRHMETAHSMVVMFMLSFSRTAHTLQDELTSVVKAMTMTMVNKMAYR